MLSLTLRKEHRLRMSENRALRRNQQEIRDMGRKLRRRVFIIGGLGVCFSSDDFWAMK
jgi:hypothetical protein